MCAHTHGRNLRHTKYRLRQSKMIGQRKSGRNAKFKLPQMLNSLSLSLPICLSTCTICMYMCIYLSIYLSIYISHFILDTLPVHYFLSLWEFFSVKLKSQAPLLTTGVVPKIQRSYHQNPTLISGQESKPCLKLLHT